MNNDELRALVRKIVADRLRERSGAEVAAPVPIYSDHSSHSSHGVYVTVVNTSDACVIEPDVPCTHCNYCKSHGY